MFLLKISTTLEVYNDKLSRHCWSTNREARAASLALQAGRSGFTLLSLVACLSALSGCSTGTLYSKKKKKKINRKISHI